MSIFKSVCKHTARVTRLSDIGPSIQKAIQIAQSGTPGPVFIEFPIDVLYPYKNAFRDCIVPNAQTLYQKLYNAYCLAHISWQFGKAFKPNTIRPLPLNIPKPSTKDIKNIASIIASAKKPLLLLGSQGLFFNEYYIQIYFSNTATNQGQSTSTNSQRIKIALLLGRHVQRSTRRQILTANATKKKRCS